MKILETILYILIIIFTIFMPLIPSNYKIKSINFTGDTILYFIVLYFLIIILFNKINRNILLKNYKSIFKDYINISMLLWIAAMFISACNAKDKLLALSETLRLSSYIILFFILRYFIKKEKVYKIILKNYMLSSFIIGVFGIYQSFMGYGILESNKFGSEIRISSFLENPNNLGMYFVFAVFPFIVLLIKDKKPINKLIYLLLTFLSLANIILSYSRNAYLGIAVGFLLLIVIFNIKYIFFTIIPVLLIKFIPSIYTRIKDIGDPSQNISRIELWKTAVSMIKDHMILGVGNGNFPEYYGKYLADGEKTNKNLQSIIHPHNAFLKAFSELGLLGFLSFTVMMISSFFKVFGFIKTEGDGFYKSFYTGVFISLFSMVFMNFLDNFFSSPKVVVYYFIVIGVCEGIKNNRLEVNPLSKR